MSPPDGLSCFQSAFSTRHSALPHAPLPWLWLGIPVNLARSAVLHPATFSAIENAVLALYCLNVAVTVAMPSPLVLAGESEY